jgi:lipooligosaccharide transport system ATP-binding protein
VPRAVCFGLLGPNGAGKSTTMNMLIGRCRHDKNPASSIRVFGLEPRNNELAIKFNTGVVPQENNLDEELHVSANLMVYSKFYAIPGRTARARIEELLRFMELTDKRKAIIRHLSGGMKRRLVIARALLNNPKLLILDEPTTGLDPQVRHLIWDRLRSLKNEGITIILSTHYMEEAYQICDTVLILDKGKKIMEGDPRRMLSSTIEPYALDIINADALGALAEPPPGVRCDRGDGSARLYAHDEQLLRSIAAALNPGEYILRRSNLEDLFLKATGRTLNERQ